jgi:hypothetical protein
MYTHFSPVSHVRMAIFNIHTLSHGFFVLEAKERLRDSRRRGPSILINNKNNKLHVPSYGCGLNYAITSANSSWSALLVCMYNAS